MQIDPVISSNFVIVFLQDDVALHGLRSIDKKFQELLE